MRDYFSAWLHEKPGLSGLYKSAVLSMGVVLIIVFSFILEQLLAEGNVDWEEIQVSIENLDSGIPWLLISVICASGTILLYFLKKSDLFFRTEFYKNPKNLTGMSLVTENNILIPSYKNHLPGEEKYKLDFCVSFTQDFKESEVRHYLPKHISQRKLDYRFVRQYQGQDKDTIPLELQEADILLLILGKDFFWGEIAIEYRSAISLSKPVMLLAREGAMLPSTEKFFPPETPASDILRFTEVQDLSDKIRKYIETIWTKQEYVGGSSSANGNGNFETVT